MLASLLSGCALFRGDPDVVATAPSAVDPRDLRIASLEKELSAARSENAELARKLAALQNSPRAAEAAPVASPALKDGSEVAVLSTPPAAPGIRPETVVAAADADRALASAPARPVEPSPRLVKPSFASQQETVFENEAGAAIPTSSVLFGVHLASYRHNEEARAGWAKLQRDFPDELGLLEARLERVDIEGRGEFQRLIGGGFAAQEKAAALCARLKAKGAYCAVAGFAGEKLSRAEPGALR